MHRPPFYTDLGPDHLSDGSLPAVPRYAVWLWNEELRRHHVVDTGKELEALRLKYGRGWLAGR